MREPCPACELHRLLEAALEQLLLVRIRGDHDLTAERMEMPEQLRSRIQLLLPSAIHCAAVDFKRQPVWHECLHSPSRRQKVALARLIEEVTTLRAREIIEARNQIEVPDKRRVQPRCHHRLEAVVVRRQGVEVAAIVLPALVMEHANVSIHADHKAGRLWNGSWTQKALHDIHEYYTRESTSNSAAYSYVIFVALNITLACSTIYLLFDLDSSLHQILFGGLLLFWIVLDLAAFRYVIKKALQNDKIQQAIANIADGDISYCVNVDEFSGRQKITADHINHIGENLDGALQEKVKSERFKADLITNVSHDLKTPLTSIINYVDLIKREHIQNEKVQGYLEVLEQKSQRLKTLTEDLVEASKASSGNLKLEITDIDFVELVHQTNGEFEEKFAQRHLELVSRLPEQPILIEADGRRLWRVLENLYNNAFKYAMEHSRIYVDITREEDMVQFTIKNISEHPLNISSDELTERFVRGDVSRTTEGSGLGLSIAESLTQLQKGTFEIVIDGDLFKVYVKFPVKKTPDV